MVISGEYLLILNERYTNMVPWSKEDSSRKIPEAESLEKEYRTEEKPASVQPTKLEQNSSICLQLGSYRATQLPISVLLFCVTCGTITTWNLVPDQRILHFPFMSNIWPCFVLCLLYILFSVVWGPRLMEHRKAYRLGRTMMVYNCIQVILCSYMFLEVGFLGWFFEYSYFCQPCDYSYSPEAIRMTRVAYLFFLSKILDFTDTIFFILHKKWAHISLLHVVHHSCMCMSMLIGIRYSAGGHVTFMGLINSVVHVLMYSYYLLAAMGPAVRPYLWWKKYLTRIQLLQFTAVFFHSAQIIFQDCSVPIGFAIWTCIYAFIFFCLFMDFYKKAYRNSEKKKKELEMNENVINGKLGENGYTNGNINGKGYTTNGQLNGNGYLSNGKIHANGYSQNGNTPNGVLQNGNLAEHKHSIHNTIKTPTALNFNLDSCLRERQTTVLE